jgi:hypothetical protein
VPLSQGATLASASTGRPAILSSPRRPPMTLPPPLATIFQQIDGARTIAQCLESAPLNAPPEIILQHGMRFFRTLSRTGHVAFRLKETS